MMARPVQTYIFNSSPILQNRLCPTCPKITEIQGAPIECRKDPGTELRVGDGHCVAEKFLVGEGREYQFRLILGIEPSFAGVAW